MDLWYHSVVCFHIFTSHFSDAEMSAPLEDTYSKCERTLQSSRVVSDILWSFLHWTLGLNKHWWERSHLVVCKGPRAAQPTALHGGCARALVSSAELAAPGRCLPGPRQHQPPGRAQLTQKPQALFSKSLLGYHSLCLRYTMRQETFSPLYLKFMAHSNGQSGAPYQLALVFSSCANHAVLTMILS